MRWTVLFLVCIATLVELFRWTVDRSSPAGIAITGVLSILSLSIGFSAVLVVVQRLSTSRVLKLLLCLAVILVLFSQFVTISGRPESWADVPVVLSSGYTEQDVSQRFTGARPSAFIQKPYMHTDLVDKLRTVTEANQVA